MNNDDCCLLNNNYKARCSMKLDKVSSHEQNNHIIIVENKRHCRTVTTWLMGCDKKPFHWCSWWGCTLSGVLSENTNPQRTAPPVLWWDCHPGRASRGRGEPWTSLSWLERCHSWWDELPASYINLGEFLETFSSSLPRGNNSNCVQ